MTGIKPKPPSPTPGAASASGYALENLLVALTNLVDTATEMLKIIIEQEKT
jgi:hypothetical protein